LSTLIVVAADGNSVAINRRSNKTHAGISLRPGIWRTAVRVGVATAVDFLDNAGWRRWRRRRWFVFWWWWSSARSSNDTSNSNSKDGEDLSELHLYRRLEVVLKNVELGFREIVERGVGLSV